MATPFREVSWADFLLADVLTSLAKALSDTERAICLLASGPIMKPHDSDQVCRQECQPLSFSSLVRACKTPTEKGEWFAKLEAQLKEAVAVAVHKVA